MVTTNVIDAVKLALEQISQDYVRLSQKNYFQKQKEKSRKQLKNTKKTRIHRRRIRPLSNSIQ